MNNVKTSKSIVNPIVRKDLKVISRSMKFSWGLFAYEAILALIFLFIMLTIRSVGSYSGIRSNTDVYEAYISFFLVIGIAQLIMISLIIPIITASSISGERERQTLDVMLTTTTSAPAIIIGKVSSAVFRVMIFVVASVPLMAISFIMGGLSWLMLLEYTVLAFVYAIMAGSIGTFCSSVCRKSIPAIIMSYVIYGTIYGITYVPLLLVAILGDIDNAVWSFLPLAFNPVQSFIVFFYGRMTGESLYEEIYSYGTNNHPIFEFFGSTTVWLIISVILQLGIAAFFIWMASLRLKPRNK
ncbi:MAG: ABC transporter permease [Eubacterium sp.]|nr:ABC transporter permease [Eubacterium sp.]